MDTNFYVGYFDSKSESIIYLKSLKDVKTINLKKRHVDVSKINACIIELDVISNQELKVITNLDKRIDVIVLKNSKSNLSKEQMIRKTIIKSNNPFLLVCNLQERNGQYNYSYIEELIKYCKNRDQLAYEKYYENVRNLEKHYKNNFLTKDNEIEFAKKVCSLIRKKDSYTEGHCVRVSKYSVKIAKELNLRKNEIFNIKVAGLVHDFGKILVPIEILTSKTGLSNSEYAIIQQHTSLGYDGLKSILSNDLMYILNCAEQHHERVDGKGYPEGLKDNEILEGAKIIAVADCFDAMTSTRSYNAGHEKTIDQAIDILKKCENTQLSQREVEAFISVIKRETSNEKIKNFEEEVGYVFKK